MDVIIIGAGIGGLTLGLALDRAGIPTGAMPWGARLFQIRDPDGVSVTFLQWSERQGEDA
jgi:2-polyprenyl-6-methoxyphenol hydroxylase-like FAD-dependent oxidoreductase